MKNYKELFLFENYDYKCPKCGRTYKNNLKAYEMQDVHGNTRVVMNLEIIPTAKRPAYKCCVKTAFERMKKEGNKI